MKKIKYHVENIFKILALIIITSELGALRILISPFSLLEKTTALQTMPIIFEHLTISLTIYIIGYILWIRLDKQT